MFGKQLKDLTDDELDLLDEEIHRLRSKHLWLMVDLQKKNL